MSPADWRFGAFEGERGAGMSLPFGVSGGRCQNAIFLSDSNSFTFLVGQRVLADLGSQAFVKQLMGCGGLEETNKRLDHSLPAGWTELFRVVLQ